jgi:transcriptional regulator with GAF, ATPase, and Fis domain
MPVVGANEFELFLGDTVCPSPLGGVECEQCATFVTDAEFRAMEKLNMTGALIDASWRVWGKGGAAELLGLNPSTFTYRMKQLGIRQGVKGA